MAKGESFDDMIHRVQTRRVSNGLRGSRPAGESAMFQNATAPAATAAAPIASPDAGLGVAPAVSLGGGKSASKSKSASPGKRPNPFAGGKGFQKGSKSSGGFSRGGGVQNFRRGGR